MTFTVKMTIFCGYLALLTIILTLQIATNATNGRKLQNEMPETVFSLRLGFLQNISYLCRMDVEKKTTYKLKVRNQNR